MTHHHLTSHRISVLLIDDQAFIGTTIERMLADENDIDFQYCQNPCEAIEIANRIHPTVILQDLVMPEVQGLVLVKYFRANPSTKDVPLIVLSGQEDANIKAEAFTLGANDYMVKFPEKVEVLARIRYHSKGYIAFLQRNEAMQELEKANRFIRQTFGRYLSDDIVDTILESPDGLTLGGEKRTLTLMMSDLRGFTSLGESLPAEHVVAMINIYLEVMTDIIFKYQGTIDEFIGDAILSIFGAPIQRDDDAQRAVACALEMQLSMKTVNERNQAAGYPDVHMGIGINTGLIVVGNIGSSKRIKYGVVGRHVNLVSRIESYTVGGQLLISESTLTACGNILRLNDKTEIMPKGVKEPIMVYDINGIAGNFNINLPQKPPLKLLTLLPAIEISFCLFTGKHSEINWYVAHITAISQQILEIEADYCPEKWVNIKFIFATATTDKEPLYAKVTGIETQIINHLTRFKVTLTSVPAYAKALIIQYIVSATTSSDAA